MTEVALLGRRAVREVVRYPEATIPTLFIPLFFLVVNIGHPGVDPWFDRLPRLGPLDEHGQIVALLAQRRNQLAILLETTAALHHALRGSLVLPEIGRGGFGFEAGQLFVGAGGFKDSSADPQRAC